MGLSSGGSNECGLVHPSADIYNPATGQFKFNGSMAMSRQLHTFSARQVALPQLPRPSIDLTTC